MTDPTDPTDRVIRTAGQATIGGIVAGLHLQEEASADGSGP